MIIKNSIHVQCTSLSRHLFYDHKLLSFKWPRNKHFNWLQEPETPNRHHLPNSRTNLSSQCHLCRINTSSDKKLYKIHQVNKECSIYQKGKEKVKYKTKHQLIFLQRKKFELEAYQHSHQLLWQQNMDTYIKGLEFIQWFSE